MEITPEEMDFLKEIESNLDDDSARLVYADWLEERGDARGEYLRLDYELTCGRGTHNELEKVVARLKTLNSSIDPNWLALVSRSAIEGCYQHFLENRNCPGRWRELKKSEDPTIRVCENCKSAIYFCTSLNDAKWFLHRHRGKVAIESTLERQRDDLQAGKKKLRNDNNLTARALSGAKIVHATFGSFNRSVRRWWRSSD